MNNIQVPVAFNDELKLKYVHEDEETININIVNMNIRVLYTR